MPSCSRRLIPARTRSGGLSTFPHSLSREHGFLHEYIATREFDNPDYVNNGPDRCFHCKDELFARLDEVARERGIAHAIYGVNDGLGAIFGIVSGVSGATLGNSHYVLLAGISGMVDRDGRLIYVGKAKCLRSRLLSYFRAGSREAKAGRIYACTRQTVGGFPFRIEVRCTEPSVELRGAEPLAGAAG